MSDVSINKAQSSAGANQAQIEFAETYDRLAGLFTGILMQLQAIADLPLANREVGNECLQRAEDLARKGLRQVRKLVEMTAGSDSGQKSTLLALRALVESFTVNSSMTGSFETAGNSRALNSSAAMTLQRILEEALRNTQRYAHAKHVEVKLCFEDERVVLEICDDGNGFVPDESLEVGFGLVGMRARADRLGGGFWLRSSPGEGTKIRVDLPNPYGEQPV